MTTIKTAPWRILLLVSVALIALAGCGGKQVTRVDVEEQYDLSGNWNDTDSQLVAAALVTQITSSSWIEDFRAENGQKPRVIVGNIRNKTAEHIPVKTFIADVEREFINGNRVKVAATSEEREQIRTERADQQEFSSQETMAQWGREKGADFMLIGEMNQIVDQEKGDAIKYYQVDCYLVDLEDNTKVWTGYEKIKKLVEN